MLTAVVPMKTLEHAKGRLAAVLDPSGRRTLARQMFDHVLATLREAGVGSIHVAGGERDLNADVTSAARLVESQGSTDLLLIMADLPYLAADDVAALIEAGRTRQVVIAEAKDGGTNALLLRPPTVLAFAFATHRPSASYHAEAARRAGIEPVVVHRPGLARDIDTPADLAALATDHPAYQVFRNVA